MMHYKKTFLINNRLCQTHNLLFFCLWFLFSCQQHNTDIEIIWTDQKASAVRVPERKFPNTDGSTAIGDISFRLKDANADILGNKQWQQGLLFEPLIPFTPGLQYYIFYRKTLLDSFTVPVADSKEPPKLVQVYPTSDTFPMNILKIYLQFSHPMRESVSAKYVKLIRNETDTLNDVFLDLQPELWNENRTVLTLWFDPGRIKRELQPNQRMGNPLQENNRYTIVISKGWTTTQGIATQEDFKRVFTAGKRDSLSPDPELWQLKQPPANTRESLTIALHETLDHFLLAESIQVATRSGRVIEGKWLINGKDNLCRFEPATSWSPGDYQLIIDAKLEDMAGNNLNKPFDRDITKSKTPSNNPEYYRYFSIY
jgi:hypothetical protein